MSDAKICRTCVKKKNEKYYNLFLPEEEEHSTTLSIIEELQLIWKLPVETDDNMPQYICETCFLAFYMYFDFKRECIKAQKKLTKLNDSKRQNKVVIKPDKNRKVSKNERLNNEEINYEGELLKVAAIKEEPCEGAAIKEELCEGATMKEEQCDRAAMKDELCEGAEVIYELFEGIKVVDELWEVTDINDLIEEEPLHNETVFIEQQVDVHSPAHPSISNDSLSSLESYGKNRESEKAKKKNDSSSKPKGYKCKYCYVWNQTEPPVYFESKLLLDVHIATTHSGDRPYKCNLCDEMYKSKGARSVHIRSKHELYKRPTCLCYYCGVTYGAHSFAKHLQTHEIGDFCCPTCGESFKNVSKFEFNKHKAWHNPKYKCSYCSKQFLKLLPLKVHLGTHSENTKPHVCHVCNKKFTLRYQMNHHISIKHERKKPLKCRFCDKCFTNYTNKTLHMRRHHDYSTPVKRYTLCKSCDQRCYKDSHQCPVVKTNS